MIEKREDANKRWTKANLTNISDTRYTVTGLTQDQTYEFRVMAKNAVGSISNPSSIAGPVACVDTYGWLNCGKTKCFTFFPRFHSYIYIYIHIYNLICLCIDNIEICILFIYVVSIYISIYY